MRFVVAGGGIAGLALAHAQALARAASESPDVDAVVERYPLYSFAGALAAAPHDDAVLRRVIGRIGLLDRTAVFDDDDALHDQIEAILARLGQPAPPGPQREDLLALMAAVAP